MNTTRRSFALGAAMLPLAPASVAAEPPNPDAALIALCEQHILNLNTFNRAPSGPDYATSALWAAYEETAEAIGEAEPRTIAGMVAKAKAAMAESGEGERSFHGNDEEWAWDLVRDLIAVFGDEAGRA